MSASPKQHLWNNANSTPAAPVKHIPAQLTAFEMIAIRLGLETENDMLASHQLRIWVKKHKDHYYIPEELLKRFGLEPTISDL